MKNLKLISLILLVIGGLNWGLVGVFEFNLLEFVFGINAFTRLIYFLVGVAAIYAIVSWKTFCICTHKKKK